LILSLKYIQSSVIHSLKTRKMKMKKDIKANNQINITSRPKVKNKMQLKKLTNKDKNKKRIK